MLCQRTESRQEPRRVRTKSWQLAGAAYAAAEDHPAAEDSPDVHGAGGPISVARLDSPSHAPCGAGSHVTGAFIVASEACGHSANTDFGRGTEGVGFNEVHKSAEERFD